MKKLIVLILVFFAASVYAKVDPAVELAATTTYQKVTVAKQNHCVPVAVWTKTGIAFYIALDSAGTGEKYIPADNSYSNNCVMPESDGELLWLKLETGTDTAYIDVGRQTGN